jgi:hypothetical protein
MAVPASPKLAAVGALVLARLLPVGEKGETAAKIQKDLEPLLGHRWLGPTLAAHLGQVLGELEADGLVMFSRGKTKKSPTRVLPTPNGRRQALVLLGMEQLKPKTTWASLRKVHLPALALGLSLSTAASVKAMASDPGFKALLLKRHYQLPAADLPKLDDVLDALAWRLIGFDHSTQKFAIKAVKTALFNRELGNGQASDFKKAVSQLLAKRLGTRGDNSKELRDAVLRGWIDRDSEAGLSSAFGHRDGKALQDEPELELDICTFAERVKAAAGACVTGRYGSNKVFVAHVWMALQSDPIFQNMSLAAFKDRLAEANNARLLDLSRADLVQAMNPDDVRQSEVRYLSATFHFVRI